MILGTSNDVLNLAIAFSVVLVAAFLCWLMYCLIAIMRDARSMVSEVRHKMQVVEEAIVAIRTKLESGVSALTVAAAGLKQVIGYVMEKREEAAERREREDEKPPARRKGWK